MPAPQCFCFAQSLRAPHQALLNQNVYVELLRCAELHANAVRLVLPQVPPQRSDNWHFHEVIAG